MMKKFKVILYFGFGPVVATKDEQPDGEPLLFDTLKEAEAYGRSKRVVYEPVEVSVELVDNELGELNG